MPKSELTTAQVLGLLAAAPPHIAQLAAGLAPEQLRAAPAPGEWSAGQVLAHMRACADMWGGSIREILAHDHPILRAINPRTWIERTDYREQAFKASLEKFAAQRAELLATLQPLAPADWQRAATITGAGRPLERSVHFYAQWLARHERPHLKQLTRIAGQLRAAP